MQYQLTQTFIVRLITLLFFSQFTSLNQKEYLTLQHFFDTNKGSEKECKIELNENQGSNQHS